MTDVNKLKQILRTEQPPEPQAHQVLAVWSGILEEALERNDGGKYYRDLFWEHTEEVSKITIKAAQNGEHGSTNWSFLCDLMEAYPADGDHNIHTPIVNAIGSGVINSRLTRSVNKAAPEGFEYLYQTAEETMEVPWEDAFCITWYFDHEDINVIDRLVELAKKEEIFVQATIETGFAVNEQKALELFKALSEKGRIDHGPCILKIDKIFTGDFPRSPRYYNHVTKHNISRSFDNETAAEFINYLQNHLNKDFLADINKDVNLPLIRGIKRNNS